MSDADQNAHCLYDRFDTARFYYPHHLLATFDRIQLRRPVVRLALMFSFPSIFYPNVFFWILISSFFAFLSLTLQLGLLQWCLDWGRDPKLVWNEQRCDWLVEISNEGQAASFTFMHQALTVMRIRVGKRARWFVWTCGIMSRICLAPKLRVDAHRISKSRLHYTVSWFSIAGFRAFCSFV